MKNILKATLLSSFVIWQITANATEIEFWTTDTQENRLQAIQLLADTFEALTDNTVKVVPISEEESATQLAKAFSVNAAPDVVHIGAEVAGSLGEEGVVDRETTSSIITEFGVDKFYKGALNALSSSEANVYNAVPFYGWVQGIWYRADLFEEAGLNPPATWEDIIVAAKHFNDPKNSFYGMLVPSKLDQFADQVFTQFALSNGAKMFDQEGNNVFNSLEMVETLEFYKELAQYSPPGQQTWRARDYYIQNKMAMFPYSSFIMDDLALAEAAASSLTADNFEDLKGGEFDENLVEKTRMVPTITHTETASYGQITGLSVVNGNSEEKKVVSKEWILFLLEEENTVSWAHTGLGGTNPAVKAVASSDSFLDDPVGLFERYGQDKIVEIVNGMEDITKFTTTDGVLHPLANVVFAKGVIPEMIQKALWEDMSSEDAVAWAAAQIDKIVAENKK